MQGQGRYPRSIPGKHTKLVLMSCRYASAIGLLVIVKQSKTWGKVSVYDAIHPRSIIRELLFTDYYCN